MAGTETACRSCGSPIVWAVGEAGDRLIPLDADPAADGNVLLVGVRPTAHGSAPVARVLGGSPAQPRLFASGTRSDGPRYRPHWATCPDADT